MVISKEFLLTAASRAPNQGLVRTVLQRVGALVRLANRPALGLKFKAAYKICCSKKNHIQIKLHKSFDIIVPSSCQVVRL